MQVGRNRLLDQGLAQVQFCQAPAETLPFADATFDCACISFGIRNFTNKDQALVELLGSEAGAPLLVLEFSNPQIPFWKPPTAPFRRCGRQLANCWSVMHSPTSTKLSPFECIRIKKRQTDVRRCGLCRRQLSQPRRRHRGDSSGRETRDRDNSLTLMRDGTDTFFLGLKHLLAQVSEQALRLDPQTTQQFRAFAGQVIEIHCLEPDLTWHLVLCEERVDLRTGPSSNPNVQYPECQGTAAIAAHRPQYRPR